MKNLSVLFIGVSLLSTYASARTYHCTYEGGGTSQDFGREFNATVPISNSTIKLTGTEQGVITGTLDATYRPINRNVGSIRFHSTIIDSTGGGTGCDDVDVILSRLMALGHSGHITMVYDCDSDGTGPTFDRYRCREE